MKKSLHIIILCLLALALLTACGPAEEATEATEAAEAAETAEATETADTTDTAETTEAIEATDAAATTEADTAAADTETAAADTYTVVFDSRGGSAVEDAVIEVGQPLHLGANPTKEGSTFVTWEDQWGMPIGHGAEDTDVEWEAEAGQTITLYAVWE